MGSEKSDSIIYLKALTSRDHSLLKIPAYYFFKFLVNL
jgi:hypothetical protein